MRSVLWVPLAAAALAASGLFGGCSSHPMQNSSSTGGGADASSSGSGHEGAGKSCGQWDAANAKTSSPHCTGSVSKKCTDWANATVPPTWPAFDTECGAPDDPNICFVENFTDLGPSCQAGSAGDAMCGELFQGFVKGDGTAIGHCQQHCDTDGKCTFHCNVIPDCGPPPHGCPVNQICVRRPGKPEACETPCD
jgi:hypothetical protein